MLRWSVLCEPRNALNAVALIVGLVAAILMACYPPRVTQYTNKGEATLTIVSNPTEAGQRRGTSQQHLSTVAPWLLGLAFLLQFIAVLLP